MSDLAQFGSFLGALAILCPFALVVILGLPALAGAPVTERAADRACRCLIATGLAATLGVLLVMLATGERHLVVNLGNWVTIASHGGADHGHYHFAIKFEFDRLSVPLALLSFALCGTIAAFATRYLHREPGYNRFFVLFSVFLAGMVTASLADTIETLFAGWELVGLSSALLVAFFQERANPARNGFRVWIVYRVSDAALLFAAVALHHMTGEGDFDKLMAARSWPDGQTTLTEGQALLIGSLLLLAAMGKSALVPFSGWLPRAMEGPTPSSAVFYGALSVHLGAFLLLRLSPLIAVSPPLAVAIVAVGLLTALYAHLAGTVQTDIKSALSFASLSQVGLIVAEIGAGHWEPFMWYVALTHLLGHACLRTLQFVRAPSLLRDYRELENALGARLPQQAGPLAVAPGRWRAWLYRFALERGYLDAVLGDYVAAPFVKLFKLFDRWERQWTAFLNQEGASDAPARPALPKPPPDERPAPALAPAPPAPEAVESGS
ncbi:NADH-quinone oxidoreductase subunit L [Gemmata obscuriglobus]|uniref:Oxidoreductase n=1 Tax=Gemmata obscuriglobus TaxID=114 RepID=A0A2Z3H9A9_9BACT|nr:proton-conducting transporter membrane subunit [Gemmata obscuriglobus]AWM40206.1 oxidoreductase [Gemmata obscuriglobus]QEG26606.1 NADH-quinone oxidoreductase subunit L [Gemmata obscuriglobus]VTS02107.1 nadh dehydrogenase : NADH subunit 5 OS=Planctomyces maris DSM 8797 GN=PM8797T_24566 PE=4 SV=1: Oxidored_q1_N: Oxidored_q1 [Gemmata obscuriglobus UQM 2246]